jgi:choline dehydrogenase-like flavoprotein
MTIMALIEADFVIIGGGTAGLVLARRLSDDPKTQVLILEAGNHQPENPLVTTPALWPGLLGTDADWNFIPVPQVRSPDKKDRPRADEDRSRPL